MSNSKRDMEIDTLKGILTILMIVSHAMSFIGVENTVFTFYVNITTFSGFMFCFGYVSDSAYFQKDKIPYIRLFKSAIKTLGVYFMSSTLYYILVIQKFTKNILIDIFTLKSIAGYSEFLLSWSYLYVLIIILFPLLKITRKNKGVCLIICIISLLCTFINYDHLSLQLLGPLIGYKALCYFPLLQYFSYFVIGIYFKANSIIMNVSLFITCLIGSFSCLIYIWITKSEPIRWGPSFYWIVGGYLYIYIYFIFVKKIKISQKIQNILNQSGKNSLQILLLNNFLCFFCYFMEVRHINLIQKYVILTLIILVSLAYPFYKKLLINKT